MRAAAYSAEVPAPPAPGQSSSSSPDETLVAGPLALLDDFWTHQELLKRVASKLRLEAEELQE